MTVELRGYQQVALDAMRVAYAAGCRAILLASPTGSGKGTVAVYAVLAAMAKGKRSVFLAPRRVIVDDMFRRLVKAGMPPEYMGILMGADARANPDAPVQVASIDTLLRREIEPPALLIFDESHMALDKCKAVAARFPGAYILGMTATPTRADGRGLGELYKKLVVVATPSQLVEEGYIVKPQVWTVPAEKLPDLDGVPTLAGDYDPAALAKATNKPPLVGSILSHWKQRAEERRTVVFAVDRAHARAIEAEFVGGGVPAEYLDADTSMKDRDAIFARLESRETLVLASVGILTTGWDQPSAKCAVLARATQSDGLLVQMCGRVLRPWQGVGAIVLDHAGNFRRHGLPTTDREYRLDGKKSRGEIEEAGRTCKSCYCICEPWETVCPGCGKPLRGKIRPRPHLQKNAEGELVELTENLPPTETDKRAYWFKLIHVPALAAKPGIALGLYRKRYNEFPPLSWRRKLGGAGP